VLCTSEAVTNAITHGGGLVAVRAAHQDRTIRVEVEDPTSGQLAIGSPDPTDTTGRGLLIIDTMASRWGAAPTDGGGKVVWFEIDLPAPASPLVEPMPAAPRRRRPLRLMVAPAAGALALWASAWTATLDQPEVALAVSGGVVVLLATVAGGFGAGAFVALVLAVGAFLFHDDNPLAADLSPFVVALGAWLGGVVAAALTWAFGELRGRARSRSKLFDRLARLSSALSGIESADDPVAEIERLVADTAGAESARVLPSATPFGGAAPGSDPMLLPLDGPRRHRTLELRGLTAPGRIAAEEHRGFLRSVADRCGDALERVELRDAERRARADVELLADASRALSESLDVDRVIAALRGVVVPRLADRCAVLLDAPVRPGTEPPGGDVSSAGWSSAAAAMELRSRGRRLGRMVATRTQPPFDDEDRALLTELAARAAVALDNAQIYEEKATSTGVLEGSLLPHALLPVPDLDVAARYLSATSGHLVGGDFYDAVRMPEGGVVLLVGDVQGKGVEAATLTAVARHTLRSAALAGEGPSGLLERVNEALRYHQAERDALGDDVMVRFVTAAVAKLQPVPTGFRATIACGGHPYPIVVRAGGEVEHVVATGPLLGVFDVAGCDEVVVDLGLSDVLALYTDGVVEHREAADLFDELQLGRLLRNQLTITGADDLAQLVLDTVVDVTPVESRDDIAVVVARVTGPR
jgi:serine phosphatase RsbU (regulator of sigma subunit)